MAHSSTTVFPKKENIYKELRTTLGERLFCRKCVRYFSLKSEFSKHIEEHIKETSDGKLSYMSYIEKYICSSCGQQFEVKSDLIIHYNTVCFDAPYTCKHCKENCENPPFLQMHLLFHHNYTEEMLRDEGFLTDIDNNVLVSRYSFTKDSRGKGFKLPPSKDELYSIEHDSLSNSRLSDRKTRRVRGKRENLAFHLLDKAYTCEICYESFSRKCVLDIHAQRHDFENTKGKSVAREVLPKSSNIFRVPDKINIQQNENNDVNEVSGQHSNSLRAILKPCNVILGSSVWEKVLPKSEFKSVITSVSSKKRMRKSKILETFEENGLCSNNRNSVSCPSGEVSGIPAWKKVKLRSKIPNFAVSEEQHVLENRKKRTRRRKKIQNDAASEKKTDPVTSKKKRKPRKKIQNIVASNEQKDPQTASIAKNSDSSKVTEDKKAPKIVEKQVYICEICKKQFSDNFKLKRHFFIHSGERPYTCKMCKKTFTRDDHMKRHVKRVCSKKKNAK